MRDKFSEMIAAGVARFDYTNIAHPMGETDPVCRAYNNIFSIFFPLFIHINILLFLLK